MKFFVAVAVVLTVLTGCSAVAPDTSQQTVKEYADERGITEEEAEWQIFKDTWDRLVSPQDRIDVCRGWNEGGLYLRNQMLDGFFEQPGVADQMDRGQVWTYLERVCP